MFVAVLVDDEVLDYLIDEIQKEFKLPPEKAVERLLEALAFDSVIREIKGAVEFLQEYEKLETFEMTDEEREDAKT